MKNIKKLNSTYFYRSYFSLRNEYVLDNNNVKNHKLLKSKSHSIISHDTPNNQQQENDPRHNSQEKVNTKDMNDPNEMPSASIYKGIEHNGGSSDLNAIIIDLGGSAIYLHL